MLTFNRDLKLPHLAVSPSTIGLLLGTNLGDGPGCDVDLEEDSSDNGDSRRGGTGGI